MVCQLPISRELQDGLAGQFARIDDDNSGGVNLSEFLYFFLQYKPITDVLNSTSQLVQLLPSGFLPSYQQQKRI